MKKIFLILSLFAFIGLTSCKKDELIQKQSTPATNFSRLKIENDVANDTTFYSYDALGRCIKMTYSAPDVSGIYHDYSEFSYETSNKIIEKTVYNNKTDYIFHFLNEKGYVSYDVTNLKDTMYYYYDVNGYHLDAKEQELVIENGNVLKRIMYNTTTHEYTYYTDKKNTLLDEMRGLNIWGKSNTNLLKSEKYGSSMINYTYEFDNKDRIVKKFKQEVNDSSSILQTIYTYTD